MAVDINRVHARLLEMGKTTANILEKHNVPYIMIAGTLLGAVRHGGFIPWDDDFDLCLFDNTYDEAIKYLREELPPDLFLEDAKSEPLYFHAWTHIKDLQSEAYAEKFPQDNCYAHKGIHIDLYRLKKMKLCEVAEYQNSENRAYIMRRRRLGLMSDVEYGERMNRLADSEERAKTRQLFSEKEVFAIGAYFLSFASDDIFPLKKYKFEDTEFFGPFDVDKVLTTIYGDYMILPSPEKRTGHCSTVRFFDSESKIC